MKIEYLDYFDWFCSETDSPIYGTLYGEPIKEDYTEENICKLNNWELSLTKQREGFWYRWGFPGPDITIYNFKDYGITWAFSKQELLK